MAQKCRNNGVTFDPQAPDVLMEGSGFKGSARIRGGEGHSQAEKRTWGFGVGRVEKK